MRFLYRFFSFLYCQIQCEPNAMTLLQKLRCSLSYSNKLLKSEHTTLATKQPLSEYAKKNKADYLPKSKYVTQIWVNNGHIFLLIAIKPLLLQGLRYNGMGMTNKLVGRERECQELHRVMESDRSEFVIVYGRRRVGKTFLVDQYYHGQYDFTFVGGHNLSRQRQLTSFARALKKFSVIKSDKISYWIDAFDAL